MFGSFSTANLDLNHVQIMVRGMYAVAEVDGVHQSEMVMLREFYDACRQDVDGLTDFDQLVGQKYDAAEAADILNTDELKQVFLVSCLFLAFADGVYTDPEKEIIVELASGLGVDETALGQLHEVVKDQLLQQISKIENVDELKAVAESIS